MCRPDIPEHEPLRSANEPISARQISAPEILGGNRYVRTDDVSSAGDEHLAVVEAVIQQIRELWFHGDEYRIAIGHLLIELHDLLAKPGYGTFMRRVSDPPPAGLGIPYTTARDYMRLAEEADGRPYGIRNDDASAEAATEEIAVVDNVDRIAEAVQLERDKVAEAEAEGRYSDVLRIDCRVAPELHDKCRARIKQLGLLEAGARLYKALFPEEFHAD
jgi:hypothetical protein